MDLSIELKTKQYEQKRWREREGERDRQKSVCVCVCVLEMHFLVREQNKKLSCKKHLDSCALRSKKMFATTKTKNNKIEK